MEFLLMNTDAIPFIHLFGITLMGIHPTKKNTGFCIIGLPPEKLALRGGIYRMIY